MPSADVSELRGFETTRSQPLRHDLTQTIALNALAFVLLALILYLYYYQPVLYVWLITEDHVGENAQALGFAVAGALLLALAWRPGPLSRRLIWALIALVALFLAAEEISWGERILDGLFGIGYPEAVREVNLQDEFNLHNTVSQSLLTRTLNLAALAVVAWLAFSAAVIAHWPRLAGRLDAFGVPLIPAPFYGLFLAAVFVRLTRPVARADEIFELFLAFAVAAWTFHLYLRHRRPAAAVGRHGFVNVAALLALLVALGGALAPLGSHDELTDGYNRTAHRDYPLRGLYAQADALFAYIYRNPRHELPDTRFKHARLLVAQGRSDEAAALLADAVREAAAAEGRDDVSVEELRRFATAHQVLGHETQAQAYFKRALELNRAALDGAPDGDERAELHWQLARTLEAQGDLENAIAAATAGMEAAASRHQSAVIGKWLRHMILIDRDEAAAPASLFDRAERWLRFTLLGRTE